MKKFLVIFLLIIFGINISYANNEGVVRLYPTEVNTLRLPESRVAYKASISEDGETLIDTDEIYDYDDEEIEDYAFENKAGKNLEKFLNDRVVNKKFNVFSATLGKQTGVDF